MLSEIKTKKTTWINVESPAKEEIAELQKRYNIHILVAEELTQPTIRPKTDFYDNCVYLILHFPIFNIRKQTSVSKEIDFVIGKDFLITVHYDTIIPLHEFFKMVQSDSVLRKKCLNENSGFAFFYLVKRLYNFSLREIDHIQKKVEKIEEILFKNKEKEIVRKISLIKRDAMDFKRIIKPHGAVLRSLGKENSESFFSKKFPPYLNDLIGEYFKIRHLIENHEEVIESLHSTNESLLSIKTNEVMKILAIMAFITFPLMLLSSIFGMNTSSLPIVGIKGDFWIIIAIMATGTFFMFVFFRIKKWL